jgi:hypothetical protein
MSSIGHTGGLVTARRGSDNPKDYRGLASFSEEKETERVLFPAMPCLP